MLDEQTTLQKIHCRKADDKLLSGSISHRFVTVMERTNSQSDYYDLEMAEDEMVLLRVRDGDDGDYGICCDRKYEWLTKIYSYDFFIF